MTVEPEKKNVYKKNDRKYDCAVSNFICFERYFFLFPSILKILGDNRKRTIYKNIKPDCLLLLQTVVTL